jgi:hypothetical protein
MQGKLMKGLRTGDQTTGPLGAVPGEVITSNFGRLDKGLEFIVNRVHEGVCSEIADNDATILAQDFDDVFWSRRAAQCLKYHVLSSSVSLFSLAQELVQSCSMRMKVKNWRH